MDTVAIIGRPNVGKSTLFNRMVGAREAIVADRPGITRDRIYHEVNWAGRDFLAIDTGGIVLNSTEELSSQVLEQVQLALTEADVLIFLVDGKVGLSGGDYDAAKMLREAGKPVILAVNKIDTPGEENNTYEFYRLGLGEPISLSALRGTGGVGDLLDRIVDYLPPPPIKSSEDSGSEKDIEQPKPLSLAIVGKPNVGKSSILNALAGFGRTIVSSEPGTTRDAIDIKITFQEQEYILVDTAGVRRKSKVDYGVEAFAVARALRAIGRADVVALMLDASQEISNQEQKLATKIEEAGKPAVIVFNKWDLVSDKSSRSMNEFLATVKRELRTLDFADAIFVSATNRLRINNLLLSARKAYEQSCQRISTAVVNQVINQATALSPPPPGKRSKRLRIYYCTQVDITPPEFLLFVNDPALMTANYQQYLERKLREAFNFAGTPIKFKLKARERNK